MVILKI